MPVYHFRFRIMSGELWPDPVGSELADDYAAILEASLAARELGRGRKDSLGDGSFEIYDETGRLVETVSLKEL